MPNVAIIKDYDDLDCIVTPSSTVNVTLLTGPVGPVGTADATLMRGFAYPTARPSTPQLFSMIWIDVNGTPWLCPAGSTTWMAINTVA